MIRISINENPLGPGQHVVDAIVGKFPEAARYPFNARQHEGPLPAALAAKFPGAKAENVVLGAGSGEILTNAVRAFTSPTQAAGHGLAVVREPARHRREDRHAGARGGARREPAASTSTSWSRPSKGAGLVFFCNPNNPTATVHGTPAVADFVKRVRAASPDTVILIDEAYHDYVTDPALQDGDGHREGDAERVRGADVLEGLRHGRPARRLRRRRRADHQAG